MSGCDKIEALLWEKAYGTISEKDDEFLRQHLADCAACRKIQSTIEALGDSRKTDEKLLSRIDPDEFEAAVMQKIRARESEMRMKREDKSYMVRMYFSVGLAAAIVAFMFFSMADLERFIIPSKASYYSRVTTGKKYETLHIELQPGQAEVNRESSGPAAAEKGEVYRDESKTTTTALSQGAPRPDLKESDVSKFFEKEQEVETPTSEMIQGSLTILPEEETRAKAEEKNRLEIAKAVQPFDLHSANESYLGTFRAGRMGVDSSQRVEMNGNQFQILNQPVTNPAPDSVAINSIYLMGQSIPMASQQTRAYLPEVIVDSGTIQSVETPRSVLVTVDKMPIPVKIIPPEYPVWARKNGISGTVWVKAHVNENGEVEDAEIASSSNPGYGFEEATLDAAKQCKYLPAEANGYRIGVWLIYPVNFVFKNK